MEKELFDMKTDIQIAQEATLLPISQVAAAAGIDEDLLEHYGKVKAKTFLQFEQYVLLRPG